VTQPLLARITDDFEIAIGQLPQIADQVWAPVTASDCTDPYSFLQRFHTLLVSTTMIDNYVFISLP
jgi:hypothetical protein